MRTFKFLTFLSSLLFSSSIYADELLNFSCDPTRELYQELNTSSYKAASSSAEVLAALANAESRIQQKF